MKPLTVKLDLEVNAGYVTFRHKHGELRQLDVLRSESGEIRTIAVGEDEEHSPQVVIDEDAHGIVGIEFLGFDAETLALARDAATARGLAWPEHIEGAVSLTGAA